MKRYITLILILSLSLALVACGKSVEEVPETTVKSEASKWELTKAADYLKKAEDDIISAAAHQLDGWTSYSNIMEYYFVDSTYKEASTPGIKDRAWKIHNLRTSAKEDLDEAKKLMGESGTSDYYLAVKEYYKSVNSFWNLISTFPEGYSLFTFSSTVSDYKTNCQNAYAELEFYK